MAQQKEPVNVDIDALINWIESRPELRGIREQAEESKAIYRPNEKDKRNKIKLIRDKIVLTRRGNPLRSFLETIWVPSKKLRGTSYSTSSVDSTLGSTSKMLSISTLWDFVCTLPLFTFGLSPLGAASIPGAVVLSYLILWASNVAGEKSTDRHDKVQSKSATISIIAFLLLSLTKTAFSGVGVDLVLGSRGIQGEYAGVLATEKLVKQKDDFEEEIKPRSDTLLDFEKTCAKDDKKLDEYVANRNQPGGEQRFHTQYTKTWGPYALKRKLKGLTTDERKKTYGLTIPGSCNQYDLRRDLHDNKVEKEKAKIEKKTIAISSMPALAYLKEHENQTYKEHFREVGNEIEWVNGTTAVAQATQQFWSKLLAGKFGLLGFPLFFLIISLILSITASLMLYQVSVSQELKASFDDDVLDELNNRLQRYTKTIENQINEEL